MVSYQQALQHVLDTGFPAYTANIQEIAGHPTSAQIYVIWCDEDNIESPEEYGEYRIDYLGGDFNAGAGEEDSFEPDQVPNEAKLAQYELMNFECDVVDVLSYDVNVVLEVFKGHSLDDVLDELE